MDVSQYRQPWESDEHWVFRKEFIVTHKDRFPNEDRLLSLAQVFANVELLGCSYPKLVMDQMKELSAEIPEVQQLRAKRSERTIVKFVKDTSEGASRYAGKRSQSGESGGGPPKKTFAQNQNNYPTQGSANRMDAAALFNSGSQHITSSEETIASYYTVKGSSKGENPLSPSLVSYNTIHFVKAKDNKFGNVAKGERVSSAFVSQETPQINNLPVKPTSVASELSKIDVDALRSKFQNVSTFIIKFMAENSGQNKVQILNIACQKNYLKSDDETNANQTYCEKNCPMVNGFHCALYLEEVLIGLAVSRKKKEARQLAYENGIRQLKNGDFQFKPIPNWTKSKLQLMSCNDDKFLLENGKLCKCFAMKIQGNPSSEMQEFSSISNKAPKRNDALENKFRVLSLAKSEIISKQKPNNELQLLDIMCSKCGLNREYEIEDFPKNSANLNFIASLHIAKILTGKGAGTNKKNARVSACKRSLTLLSKDHFRVVPLEFGKPQMKLIASDDQNFGVGNYLEPFDPNLTTRENSQATVKYVNSQIPWNISMASQVQRNPINLNSQRGKKKKSNARMQQSLPKPKDLILIDDRLVNPGTNDITRLVNFCHTNRSPATFDFDITNQPTRSYRCTVVIDGKIEGMGVGETKQLSKLLACQETIKNLQRRIYTVQIKPVAANKAQQINKHQVANSTSQELSQDDSAINSGNIGFQMLQMMGWKGGGIGKEETGINKPISVLDVYGREGLGFAEQGCVTKEFKAKISEIISQFAKSHFTNELKFSPDFTKEERTYMHHLAEKNNLKTVSKGGQGSGRYLVMNHKLSPDQLLRNLLIAGGNSDKYTLIPPTENQ